MPIPNHFVKTVAGISVAGVLLITLMADRTSAEGDTNATRTLKESNGSPVANPEPRQDQNELYQRGFHQLNDHQPPSRTPHSGHPTDVRPPSPPASPSFDNRHLPSRNHVGPPQSAARYGDGYGYVAPASATRASATRPAHFMPAGSPGSGLPQGEWLNETPMGKVKLTVAGNKIAIDVQCTGELHALKPSMRGEFSVASDGTVFGLIHSVDLGITGVGSEEMDEDLLLLGGSLSDIPFSIRAYSEPGVLAIKQVSIGMPLQIIMATDGECGEFGYYAQTMMAGLYEQQK